MGQMLQRLGEGCAAQSMSASQDGIFPQWGGRRNTTWGHIQAAEGMHIKLIEAENCSCTAMISVDA
jgi:hypothetical protein